MGRPALSATPLCASHTRHSCPCTWRHGGGREGSGGGAGGTVPDLVLGRVGRRHLLPTVGVKHRLLQAPGEARQAGSHKTSVQQSTCASQGVAPRCAPPGLRPPQKARTKCSRAASRRACLCGLGERGGLVGVPGACPRLEGSAHLSSGSRPAEAGLAGRGACVPGELVPTTPAQLAALAGRPHVRACNRAPLPPESWVWPRWAPPLPRRGLLGFGQKPLGLRFPARSRVGVGHAPVLPASRGIACPPVRCHARHPQAVAGCCTCNATTPGRATRA